MSTPQVLAGSTAIFFTYAFFARTVCVHSREKLQQEDLKYKHIHDRFLKGQGAPLTIKQIEAQDARMKELRQDVDNCKNLKFIFDFFKKEN